MRAFEDKLRETLLSLKRVKSHGLGGERNLRNFPPTKGLEGITGVEDETL